MLKILILWCLFVSSFAWLLPERCAQNNKLFVQSHVKTNAVILSNSKVKELAKQQQEILIETYKKHKFIGLPIRATGDNFDPASAVKIQTPLNCSFNTYEPRLLSSVACDQVSCKLSHTVSTTDTYAASEGYNWGVKISGKAKLSDVFEIGGEASTGGTYTCTYTKGRTTTDLVECSDSGSRNGHLQLYSVKSDLVCDFGEVGLETEKRDGESFRIVTSDDYFTDAEQEEIRKSILNKVSLPTTSFMMDLDKITDRLLNKFRTVFPHFNPYTDFVMLVNANQNYARGIMSVQYYKKTTESAQEYRRVIPFTNENGDSVFQYACTKELF